MVLFTGGGTGGHVFPGLAVAHGVRDRTQADIAWVGGTCGMERSIVRHGSVAFYGIPTGKLRRYLSLRNLSDVFRVAAGVARSVRLIRRLRPRVLFSKGGFVSVPPVVAAWLCGVPVVSHESDSDPGLATRINARFSQRVLVPYESTRDYFPRNIRERVQVVGNPIRSDVLRGHRDAGLEALGFSAADERPVVFFVGGSLGARQINELVSLVRPRVESRWRIVHQTGAHALDGRRDADYVSAPFFAEELPNVLAAADMLVCRAGASTLWEAAALSRPMLLVPLSEGSRGDQVRNAAVFEAAGGARAFTDPERLAAEITDALVYYADHPGEREEMGTRARTVVRLDATERIVDLIAAYMRGEE
ncbi:MAG: undecaprenyldiphospho-muramoylpentapeptide beta-N-acetylglucosaminyltransferase [Spirochaetota bacterium]